ALPVGNGRMGAMVFGGAAHERIQFNESTVWTGEPHDYSHKGAGKYLQQIRELLWAGKQKEAEDLAMKEFMSDPIRQKAYQAFGELDLDQGVYSYFRYKRWLDLDSGIASVEYTQDDVTYRRDVFASYPANAIVVQFTSNKASPLNVYASFKSAHVNSKLTANAAELVL